MVSVDSGDVINDYCIDNCDGITYSQYNLIYTDNGVKKCLKSCPSGTYKDYSTSVCITLDNCAFYEGNTCYSSCPTTNTPSTPYHKYGSKECIASCPDTDYIYLADHTCYRKEDCNYVSESGSTHTCLSSCSTFHDNNSNVCITKCGEENANKKYYANGDNIFLENIFMKV